MRPLSSCKSLNSKAILLADGIVCATPFLASFSFVLACFLNTFVDSKGHLSFVLRKFDPPGGSLCSPVIRLRHNREPLNVGQSRAIAGGAADSRAFGRRGRGRDCRSCRPGSGSPFPVHLLRWPANSRAGLGAGEAARPDGLAGAGTGERRRDMARSWGTGWRAGGSSGGRAPAGRGKSPKEKRA
jgi:hypothetical protein